ncbi:hypothetical protein BGZ72_001494, partial [Mortierella alpina]
MVLADIEDTVPAGSHVKKSKSSTCRGDCESCQSKRTSESATPESTSTLPKVVIEADS